MKKPSKKHPPKKKTSTGKSEASTSEGIRLNKFVANSGLCSRRKADEFIKRGEVKVNGEVVREMGYKVQRGDEVLFQGKPVKPGKKTYLLLNKPKNVISTTHDPQGRKTVLDLVRKASPERLYPVGRLDRNTTGLILLTNDGDLAQKLAHPSYEVSKLYYVLLDKPLTKRDLKQISNGVKLEEGIAYSDEIAYTNEQNKCEVGIKVHFGWNRVVRRIFEKLGYNVVKLDRVMYAHLTKKDLPRGRWRELSNKEVIALKHFRNK